jgi:hypothetical protein
MMYQRFDMWMFVEGKKVTVMAYFKVLFSCTPDDKSDKMMVVLPTEISVWYLLYSLLQYPGIQPLWYDIYPLLALFGCPFPCKYGIENDVCQFQ